MATDSPAASTGPKEATTYCANDDHVQPRRARFRVTWPSGRFRPTTACVQCSRWIVLDQAVEAGCVALEVVNA